MNLLIVPYDPIKAKELKITNQNTYQRPKSGKIFANRKLINATGLEMVEELKVSGSEANIFLQNLKRERTKSISVQDQA